MIEIEEEREIAVIETDVQYVYDTLKPMALSFRGSTATEINTKLIDTSNVTDMGYMFAQMPNIETLDLSHFDTSNVTIMTAMFYQSRELKELDLSHFDVSNVTLMNSIFTSCRNLEKLDISGWNTKSLTNMSQFVMMCSKLTSLDLSSFDTSKVTSMFSSFLEANNLEEIKGIIDMQNVTSAGDMFGYCAKLKEVRLKNLKISLPLNNAPNLSTESINYLLMNVQDVSSPQTITLGSNLSKASEEAITNATSKGWTVN